MLSLVCLGMLLVPCLLVGGSLALFWKKRRRRVLRWSAIVYLALVAFFFLGAGPFLAAWSLAHAGSRPADQLLQGSPADFGISHEEIAFDSLDGLKLSGWFIPPSGKKAIVIGTHGLFRNRQELLTRAVSLAREGYGSLLYDSRSHGKSQRGEVSLGYNESNDVQGAMLYLRRRYQDAPQQPALVLLGVSMGAGAALTAAAEGGGCSALIVDSPFGSLRETVAEHLWFLFKLPRYPFAPLFLFWFRQVSGADPDRLDLHRELRRIPKVPLLVIASEGDVRMGTEAARILYGESESPAKKLRIFGRDVTHGAAARLHPEEYARVVNAFLAEALAAQDEAATSPNGRAGSLP